MTALIVTPLRIIFVIVLVGTTLPLLAERYRRARAEEHWRKRVSGTHDHRRLRHHGPENAHLLSHFGATTVVLSSEAAGRVVGLSTRAPAAAGDVLVVLRAGAIAGGGSAAASPAWRLNRRRRGPGCLAEWVSR